MSLSDDCKNLERDCLTWFSSPLATFTNEKIPWHFLGHDQISTCFCSIVVFGVIMSQNWNQNQSNCTASTFKFWVSRQKLNVEKSKTWWWCWRIFFPCLCVSVRWRATLCWTPTCRAVRVCCPASEQHGRSLWKTWASGGSYCCWWSSPSSPWASPITSAGFCLSPPASWSWCTEADEDERAWCIKTVKFCFQLICTKTYFDIDEEVIKRTKSKFTS